MPTFLPAGPVIVPRSAIANPGDLRITLRLNGQVMQDESTKDMLFDTTRIIAGLPTWTCAWRRWTRAAWTSRPSVAVMGPGQVTLGSDYPFDMGVEDPVSRLAAAGFDNATISAIRGGNAARLLGPLPGYDPSPRCCAVPDRSA